MKKKRHGSKLLQIRISTTLLASIDEAARANLTNRSGYVRQAIIMRLNDEHLVPNPDPDDVLELLKNASRKRPGV